MKSAKKNVLNGFKKLFIVQFSNTISDQYLSYNWNFLFKKKRTSFQVIERTVYIVAIPNGGLESQNCKIWKSCYCLRYMYVNWTTRNIREPAHDKTNKMPRAPSEDGWAWASLATKLSAQRRLWSAWVNTQADLSLRWAHMPFYWFCHALAQTI